MRRRPEIFRPAVHRLLPFDFFEVHCMKQKAPFFRTAFRNSGYPEKRKSWKGEDSLKKFLAVVLAAVLFGGCAVREQQGVSLTETPSDTQSPVPLGRYVETAWSLPPVSEESYILQIKPEGTGYDLGMSDGGVFRRFHSENGKDWEEKDATLLQAADSGEWANGLDWTEQGQYFLMAFDEGTQQMRIQRSNGDGWETLPIDWSASGDTLFPQKLTLGPDGTLFFADGMETTYRYSAQGEYLGRYPGLSFGTPLPGQIAAYEGSSREIIFCDLETGEEAGRTPVDAAVLSGGGYPLLGADGEGLFIVSTAGLFRLAAGGSLFEQLMDGGACSLGKPSMTAMDCAAGENGSFLVRFTDSGNASYLCHYAYNPDIPAYADRELTIASLAEQPTLRQAAAEFQSAHPEVLVTLRILWDEESAMTKSDVLRALHTELLAGSGPDLLALDGLPFSSYEQKGVLADLSETVLPLMESGKLLSNIAGAFAGEKGMYAVPARFTVPMLCVPLEHEGWQSLSDIARWAQEHPESRVLYNLEPRALIRLFYPSCYCAFTKEGEIDTQQLCEFLTFLKTLTENTGGENFPDDVAGLFGGTMPAYMDDELYEEMQEMLAPIRMAYGRTESFPIQFQFSRFSDFRVPYSALSVRLGRAPTPEETPKYLLPLPGMGERVFTPRCILGINAAGKEQELAAEFLRTVLSEDVQSVSLQDGLAVDAAALAASVDTAGNWSSSMRDPEGNELYEELAPTEAQLPLLTVFSSLTAPALADETLLGFLIEEALPFFEGECSAEEAAGAYAGRALAYLSE